jgi:hypothetical protein
MSALSDVGARDSDKHVAPLDERSLSLDFSRQGNSCDFLDRSKPVSIYVLGANE